MSQTNEPKVFDGSTPQSGPHSPQEPLDSSTGATGTSTTDGEIVDSESTGLLSVTSGPRSPKEPL